jgi:DNA-binding transcriptional LysR family regulator
MDRFDVMKILLAVVDAGSISAAARQLQMPLPSVSRKLAELERHLGTQLLMRTNRRVSLTEAGQSYVESAPRILALVEEAERVLLEEYQEPKGELAITAPVVLGRRFVLPIALDFFAAYPAIQGRIILVDRHVDLLEERIDVAVQVGPITDEDYIATSVGFARCVVCASPAYLARRGTPEAPEDLNGHDNITLQGFSPCLGWTFCREGRTFQLEPRTRLAVDSAEAAVDAALFGLGVVRVLTAQVDGELRSGALVPLLTAFDPKPLAVSLLYIDRGAPPLKVRTFLDCCAPRLRACLK